MSILRCDECEANYDTDNHTECPYCLDAALHEDTLKDHINEDDY